MKRPILVLVAAATITACTGGGDELADPADAASSGLATSTQPSSLSSLSSLGDSSDPTVAPVDANQPGDVASSGPVTTAPIVELPATGVPGLDSDDAFCAAWSRFGGSWQVLVVGSTFLGDPQRVATWEIAAAAVIDDAYAQLLDHFPDELTSEAEIVAEAYFGALHRRARAAAASLADAGADADVVQQLGQGWLDALAGRDPFDADLTFEVPAEVRQLVDRAVADFRSQRVEFHLDPSMVIGVETPLTDSYLETACPDQGTLSGQEVDGG